MEGQHSKIRQLIDAAINGNLSVIEQLIVDGVDINGSCNGDGYTALHMAVTWERYAVSKWLIDNDANINAVTKDTSLTPLHQAVIRCSPAMLILLINRGAACNALTTHCKVTGENYGYNALERALNPNWYNYWNAAYLVISSTKITPLAKKLLEKRQCYRCSSDSQCNTCKRLIGCVTCGGQFKQIETRLTQRGVKCIRCYKCPNRLCESFEYTSRKGELCVKCVTKYTMCEACHNCMEIDEDSLCNSCKQDKELCEICNKVKSRTDMVILHNQEKHRMCITCVQQWNTHSTACPFCRVDMF